MCSTTTQGRGPQPGPEGMMDILLTPEERDTLYETSPLHEGYPEMWEEALCRAQVRKFHLWLMTHWQSAKKLVSEADWAALKAAGGEE